MHVEIVTQPGLTQTPKNRLEFTFFRGDQENSFYSQNRKIDWVFYWVFYLAPDNIKNMFTKLYSVHSCRTRSVTNENYYVEQVKTENMKLAFSI